MRTIDDIDGARRKARISQAELCRAAEIHPATFRRTLVGRTSPTLRTLGRLAKALDDLTSDPGATPPAPVPARAAAPHGRPGLVACAPDGGDHGV